ncbi:MAG: hypothetical protein EZS28_005696 [Streblomastix strix]|uniref:Uncharacterized protein n=1 Tax=Streblomastix strix TaxID=222440 RepID=A0A5J4WUS8_9EUKA|nr:MAG: hypothetical protein EZS28_005696 [Streblomastix strix]
MESKIMQTATNRKSQSHTSPMKTMDSERMKAGRGQRSQLSEKQHLKSNSQKRLSTFQPHNVNGSDELGGIG